VNVAMYPMVLDSMVISSGQPHANLLLSMDAERRGSAAAGGGSDGGADTVGSQLQPNVRLALRA